MGVVFNSNSKWILAYAGMTMPDCPAYAGMTMVSLVKSE